MRFVPSEFQHAAMAALSPEMTVSERMGLWLTVVMPRDYPCAASNSPSPAIYVSAVTEAELCRSFDRVLFKAAAAGLSHLQFYCDICPPTSPLLDRPGLLRLMSAARTGRVALAATGTLFSAESVCFRSNGAAVSIDWLDMWSSGKPPSSKVSYLALFTGAMLTEIFCGRTNDRVLPNDYTLLLLEAFRLVSQEATDLPAILARLRPASTRETRVKDFFDLFTKPPRIRNKTTRGKTCTVRDIVTGRTLRAQRS